MCMCLVSMWLSVVVCVCAVVCVVVYVCSVHVWFSVWCVWCVFLCVCVWLGVFYVSALCMCGQYVWCVFGYAWFFM